MSVHAAGQEEKTVAEYLISKINRATGFDIKVKENGCIRLELDPSASMDDEGYTYSGRSKRRSEISVLPSGKMSRVRTITVEKQELSPAVTVEKKAPGLNMEVIDGTYLNMAELEKSGMKVADKKVIKDTREIITYRKFSEETMRRFKQYAAIATGYVDIPADGVYFFSSDLEEVWIDGKKLIDNGGLVKHFCPTDKSVALSAGLHEFKVVFLGNSYGGYPAYWNDGSINIRKSDEESFKKITPERLFH